MNSVPHSVTHGSSKNPPAPSSAVSQTLRAIRDDLDRNDGWPCWPSSLEHQFQLSVANTRRLRAQAEDLVHRVYVRSGYAHTNMKVPDNDFTKASTSTFTVLIRSRSGKAAATVSLVFDSDRGLPSDEIFYRDLAPSRASGRKMAEVTRLVIAPEYVQEKILLVQLFNFIYIKARKIECHDDFVIEVNPRHVNYYNRLLGFSSLGVKRPCPRVQGAPAQLLVLDLAHPEREIEKNGPAHGPERTKDRSLYPYFLNSRAEQKAIRFLNKTLFEAGQKCGSKETN